MTALIVFLVFALVITIVLVSKKKKTINIPPPPPIPEPTYYMFEVGISENPNEILSQISRFSVMGLNNDFCLNSEYINLDGVFSSYGSEQLLYLLYDNKKVEVRRGGENAVTRVSDCTEQL